MAVKTKGNDSHLQPELDFGTKRQLKVFEKSQQLLDEGAGRNQSCSSTPLQSTWRPMKLELIHESK